MSEEKTITIKKDALWKYSTFALIAIVVIGAIVLFSGGSSNSGGSVTDIGVQGLSVPSLKAYASQLDLDTREFNDCLDSGKYTSEVNKEFSQAQSAGAGGTPYFVIIDNRNGNTVSVSGAVPWPNIEAAINTVSTTSQNIFVQIEDNDPVLGNPDAEISIIEFSDFQCPFCARAHVDALADLRRSNYFKDGEVNLVYKHFPLSSIHPQAQKAAEASMCAWEQDSFWEYHDTLFENQ